MKNIFLKVVLIFGFTNIILSVGCKPNNSNMQKSAEAMNNVLIDSSAPNQLFTIASTEYAVLSEKALNYFASLNFDAWASMLSDEVAFSFPDGDEKTRTTLYGKKAVTDWWKNWSHNSGIENMFFSAYNHVPINVIEQPKGGFPMGIYDLVYFDGKLIYAKNTVGLRLNFTVHFNQKKLIDHYATYYDVRLFNNESPDENLSSANNN